MSILRPTTQLNSCISCHCWLSSFVCFCIFPGIFSVDHILICKEEQLGAFFSVLHYLYFLFLFSIGPTTPDIMLKAEWKKTYLPCFQSLIAFKILCIKIVISFNYSFHELLKSYHASYQFLVMSFIKLRKFEAFSGHI